MIFLIASQEEQHAWKEGIERNPLFKPELEF